MNIEEIFGSNTFNLKVMEKKLPRSVYKKMCEIIKAEHRLDPEIADEVAHALKEWALNKGATHYTHWFQPMTGSTAEKHDSFLNLDTEGNAINRLSARQLLQSEPDASSFPSGGMRTTFEARGYTAWDPTSPAFVVEGKNTSVLCIPSTFMSYYGHALDAKIPLLRSVDIINNSAVKMLKLFGKNHITQVIPTMGPEQEYFLVDKDILEKRPDLKITGRTLIGSKPAKGQEMEDHYFSSIKERVLIFMQDFENELLKVGVPAKTRHNEVAPNQYELACFYESLNIAADHNQIVMETIERIAKRHNLAALLHEKPFKGINGSGKHNNWSLQDSDGNNLLSPGENTEENLQFLVFLVAVLGAISKHGPALRAAVASAGNDHRLGANEAPPAIMSVFLGETLSSILDSIAKGAAGKINAKKILDIGVSKIPPIFQDNTDRNRTSPFAFTGDKFEFRAVGSAASISTPCAFLNTAVAESLDEIRSKIETMLKSNDFNTSVLKVLREEIIASQHIRFEGNGYSDDWSKEATKRDIMNLKTTPSALSYLSKKESTRFLTRYKVYSDDEIKARIHIQYEQYCKTVEIETRVFIRMLNTGIIPAVYQYQKNLCDSIAGIESINTKLSMPEKRIVPQFEHLREISEKLSHLVELSRELERSLEKTESISSVEKRAESCCSTLLGKMENAREICDFFEEKIDKSLWPFPTYDDMLL